MPETAPPRRRPLGGATYTFLFRGDLLAALDQTADTGMRLIELTAAPPQVTDCQLDGEAVKAVAARLRERDLTPLSFNPTYLDLNLASVNPGIRAETARQLHSGLQACHDLQIPYLVVFPGRRHALAPAPMQLSYDILTGELDCLVTRAAQLGVTLALENGPTNFLDRAEQVAALCRDIASPHVRAVFDVANSQMVEDPVQALPAIIPYLCMVHLSDTGSARWQHAPVGQGDVRFAEFGAALDAVGYAGPSIMEIVDLEEPAGALAGSARALEAMGWSLATGQGDSG